MEAPLNWSEEELGAERLIRDANIDAYHLEREAVLCHAQVFYAWMIDGVQFPEAGPYPPRIFSMLPPFIAENAHARWGLSTTFTALDLCAASLGRLNGVPLTGRGHDQELTIWTAWQRRHLLTLGSVGWLKNVREDSDYRWLRDARDRFVHRAQGWLIDGLPSAPRERVHIVMPGRDGTAPERFTVSQILELALAHTEQHVRGFLQAVRAGEIIPAS